MIQLEHDLKTEMKRLKIKEFNILYQVNSDFVNIDLFIPDGTGMEIYCGTDGETLEAAVNEMLIKLKAKGKRGGE